MVLNTGKIKIKHSICFWVYRNNELTKYQYIDKEIFPQLKTTYERYSSI